MQGLPPPAAAACTLTSRVLIRPDSRPMHFPLPNLRRSSYRPFAALPASPHMPACTQMQLINQRNYRGSMGQEEALLAMHFNFLLNGPMQQGRIGQLHVLKKLSPLIYNRSISLSAIKQAFEFSTIHFFPFSQGCCICVYLQHTSD